MKTNEHLKNTIMELANMQLELELKGGPEKDGGLFERIIETFNDVLGSFGLPVISRHERLLWFKEIPTAHEIDKLILQLHQLATDYLLSSSKSELQILQEAQQGKEDAFNVLPELKIRTHIYTCFVYDEILKKRKDKVENILTDLRFVNDKGYLETIAKIKFRKNEEHSQLVNYLNKKGVRYINQFLHYDLGLPEDDH